MKNSLESQLQIDTTCPVRILFRTRDIFEKRSKSHVQIASTDHIYIISGYSEPSPDDHEYIPLQFIWRYKLISQKWRLMTAFGAPNILNLKLCGSTGQIVDNKE